MLVCHSSAYKNFSVWIAQQIVIAVKLQPMQRKKTHMWCAHPGGGTGVAPEWKTCILLKTKKAKNTIKGFINRYCS